MSNFGDQIDKDKEKEALKMAQKYQGMSEGDLMGELMRTVSSAKGNGNFNYTELLEFANTMFPYLNEEQRTRLIDLIKMIGR